MARDAARALHRGLVGTSLCRSEQRAQGVWDNRTTGEPTAVTLSGSANYALRPQLASALQLLRLQTPSPVLPSHQFE